jgi:ubiquinone/menaquinone biosynthesis C-methylase UbiE
LLTPARIRGEEILDRPDVDPRVVKRALQDVAKTNALFGGTAAVISELDAIADSLPAKMTLLDVATGNGDIPRSARQRLESRHGKQVTTIGLDLAEELTEVSRHNLESSICGDALKLPFESRSIDVVTASQFLHHLGPEDAVAAIKEMNRVARARVIISDIRRSWVAMAGLWLVSYPLRFHRVSRYDGIVSIRRGFTRDELEKIVAEALQVAASVSYRRGFRVTASWAPVGA